jgi:hypothetical protein
MKGAMVMSSDALLDALIRALTDLKQRQADNSIIRDIVADSRRSPPSQPSSAMADVHDQASRQYPTHSKGGWVDAPKVDDWRPPGQRWIDKQLDQQDAIDRAKLKGGR